MAGSRNTTRNSSNTPFKEFIHRGTVRRIGRELAATGRPFRRALFSRRALSGLEDLELKQRVRHVAAALRDALDPDVEAALKTLVAALPPVLDQGDAVTSHFTYWPYLQFVEDYAAKPAHFDAAMAAIYEMTQRFSAEFAIRPLLAADPERTLAVLERWTSDPSQHVRRLCSEGTRPRLPWGLRLDGFIRDPEATTPILEALVDDPEEYVRRSVANHVNDIAKDHPRLAVQVCKRWSKQPAPRSGDSHRQRLVRHALRTLIKQGDPGALAVIGYAKARVDASLEVTPKRLGLGEATEIAVEVRSAARRKQKLLVDYVVHFLKKNGTLSPKVFKWTELELAAGETVELRKRHVFRQVTTRVHYPGEHRIEVQINGTLVASTAIEVH